MSDIPSLDDLDKLIDKIDKPKYIYVQNKEYEVMQLFARYIATMGSKNAANLLSSMKEMLDKNMDVE